MEKIVFESLNSAQVKVSNSVDTEKVYDIVANANISGTTVNSIDGGSVRINDAVVATFSSWGENSLNVNYQNASVSEYCDILEAITTFISDVKTKVSIDTFNI